MSNNDHIIEVDEKGNFNKTVEELDALEEQELAESSAEAFRRKDYCCRYDDGSTHNVRASHSGSAILKCLAHKPLKPVGVSKGRC